jgi:hypothetical protein
VHTSKDNLIAELATLFIASFRALSQAKLKKPHTIFDAERASQ